MPGVKVKSLKKVEKKLKIFLNFIFLRLPTSEPSNTIHQKKAKNIARPMKKEWERTEQGFNRDGRLFTTRWKKFLVPQGFSLQDGDESQGNGCSFP